MDYKEYREKILEQNDEINTLISSFWNNYSGFGTWQFWVVLSLFIAPLILLCFTVDRRRIFEIFFFGYTVHILWAYINIILDRYNFMIHPYSLTSILPYAINITSSMLPVGFLLIYQYCTNNGKNFYVYTLILSFIYSFVFASIEHQIGLLELKRGFNQFYIFLIDIGIVYIAYWATKFIKRINNSF
ncbi:hypothetical protein [Radiobacillus deserti]|uniref:Uncharacterized protein n=1 Tax=Radiobacillus deserti TaxID=2594883 RepID=A0A516KIJ6_9BACI|nr:hypothetical protein [Radiobacillus deserti]QDP41223.1 hypothetical protein FN924_14145 [Radiobacillus deserti]